MLSSEIRERFLKYFERHGHAIRPSSSLVPSDDPTLLFTNAGMVQFKKVFLGLEEPPGGVRRATTAQKCVRAGGKHNDLEQVGHTARHHTFFEMLGNFSFGDYFKRDAIRFAWEFVTNELKIPAQHLRVTVFREDDEARTLWREIAGLPDARIYGLGEKDNFWQMADTGPCGPCTEIYVDLAYAAKDWTRGEMTGAWTDPRYVDLSTEDFVEAAEHGRFVEIWNLVFMQFDRQADGTLVPLPKPSVDTGAGLERIAAVLQGVSNNFDTDVFTPLIETVSAQLHGVANDASDADRLAAKRVIADHARSIAFLLADGVFPSNDGRGYVLRRILRRAVRYAWLLGRREPTLGAVVAKVIATMGNVYPELRHRERHIVETTRAEEERFLATIDGGMRRFNELAPVHTTQERTIAGEDAFKLYDTYGFPIDLTELMARERGYTVDIPGFERALAAQRTQSQEERKSKKLGVAADELSDLSTWSMTGGSVSDVHFVGYHRRATETDVIGVRSLEDGRVAVLLRETPFYAESGGQISDTGEIVGEGWRMDVDDVRKIDGKPVAIGKASGTVTPGRVQARVPVDQRLDTERNHTATHLLHAALRQVLGEHVHQAGSLVAPDRLRFDFTHTGPLTPAQTREVEDIVNRGVLSATPVVIQEKAYQEAIATGAMALFGEKYGDVVRVVDIPALSTELCGGTHVRNTAEIGLFKIVSESGIAAGVRRVEAITGTRAYTWVREQEELLREATTVLKANPETLVKRIEALIAQQDASDRTVTNMVWRQAKEDVESNFEEIVPNLRIITEKFEEFDVKTLQTVARQFGEYFDNAAAAFLNRSNSGVSITFTSGSVDFRADKSVKHLVDMFGGRGGGKANIANASFPASVSEDAIIKELIEEARRQLKSGAK